MKRHLEVKTATRALLNALPPELAQSREATLLREVSRETALCVVQLIYRKQPYEGGSKDYEFSRQSMIDHWAAGRSDVRRHRPLLERLLRRPTEPGMLTVDPGVAAHNLHLPEEAETES